MARRIIQAVLEPSDEPFDPNQRYLTFKFYDADRNEAGPGGPPGLNAYQVWLAQGNEGTVDDYLASLKGDPGEPGADGADGPPGADGADGAPGADGPPGADGADGAPGDKGDKGDKGDPGTNGVNGANGADGLSAYQVWQAAGNSGTVNDYLASLKGAKGDKGDKGDPGVSGTGLLPWFDDFSTDTRANYNGDPTTVSLSNGALLYSGAGSRDLIPKGLHLPSSFVMGMKTTMGGATELHMGLQVFDAAGNGLPYYIGLARQTDNNMVVFSWYNGVATNLASTGASGVPNAAGQVRWFRAILAGRTGSLLFYTADPSLPSQAAAQQAVGFTLPDVFMTQPRIKPYFRQYTGQTFDDLFIR